MNHLSSTLVLCDLDHLLLGADGNLTQVVRDVLQLFVIVGGTVGITFQIAWAIFKEIHNNKK